MMIALEGAAGMQRLLYQVFLTRNSEYHVQSHVCVGVRDRRTGRWFEDHPALLKPLSTTVSTRGQLSLLRAPQLGEALEFDLGGGSTPLRTSPILNIEQRAQAARAPGARAAMLRSAVTEVPRV
jgi:hypothetical protein